jgi:hypothetical protein
MERCALSSDLATSLRDDYLRAWSTHDVSLIRDIFHEAATYNIVNRKCLYGLSEIVRYWERNKARQRALTVFPARVIHARRRLQIFIFGASFEDVEESTFQTVYGYMMLACRAGKIARLDEAYDLDRTK